MSSPRTWCPVCLSKLIFRAGGAWCARCRGWLIEETLPGSVHVVRVGAVTRA